MGVLLYSLFANKKNRLTPVDFLENFKGLEYKVQRDVYEFFNEFLNNLEDSLKFNKKPLDSLNENLKGEFINEIRFVKCGHILGMHKEEFIVLSLEVREMGNIGRSLEYFSHWELLQSSPQKCPKCGATSPREKRTRIGKLPKELIIHLKRFQFEKGRFVKLNEGFRFSEELEMEEGDSEEGAKKKFTLRGVVSHSGSLEFGHYISLVKKGFDLEKEESQREDERRDDVEQFNFRKKVGEEEGEKKRRWVIYNDDFVAEYDRKNLPKDCFGEFEEEGKKDGEKSEEKIEEKSALSEDKVELLKDLGVFVEESQEKKSKSDKNEKEILKLSQQIKKVSKMNAYLLFYRLEGEEKGSHSENVIREARESDFGKKVQLDLDKELVLDARGKAMGSRLGWDFARSLLVDSSKKALQQVNQVNLQFLFDSFFFVSNYFFKFVCKMPSSSKRNDIMGKTANLLFKFLSPGELQEKQVKSPTDPLFDEKTRRSVLTKFSLNILQIFVTSMKESTAADSEDNLWMLLVSSREDVYSSQGGLEKNFSPSDSEETCLGRQAWVVELLCQSIANLTFSFSNLCWDTKRLFFDFIKMCLKMLTMYQANASACLVVLREVLECREAGWMLHRVGFQGVLCNLFPQLFSEISFEQLRGWTNFKRFFKKSFDPESALGKCRSVQDYFVQLHSEETKNKKSSTSSEIISGKYFNFRNSFLHELTKREHHREKFGNSSENVMKQLKSGFDLLGVQVSFKFFSQLFSRASLLPLSKSD